MKSTPFICIFMFFLFNCEDAENSIAAVQNNCGLETTFVQVVDSLKWPKGNDMVLADDCGYVGVGRQEESWAWEIEFGQKLLIKTILKILLKVRKPLLNYQARLNDL